ncbi:MAG: hypothetical protein HYY01_12615 [Chloroflexi bacterium]|nr:hypothetical protein [Chloroflexota bacterium]
MPQPSNSAPSTNGVAVSFVITVWLEPSGHLDRPQWRWRVTQAGTGEHSYFTRLADLLSYIGQKAGVSPPS